MDKKSYILGIFTGVLLVLIVLFVNGTILNLRSAKQEQDQIQYLEQPVSYENKTETSFKVFQVFGDRALAMELSHQIYDHKIYDGNTVLILGKNFYNDQVLDIKNPQMIGTCNLTNRGCIVPVIVGTKGE